MANFKSEPYLSIVAASRNDDHGGDPLRRTQIFVDCLAQQCDKLRLQTELIIVDWNPVEGRPGLAGVLKFPAISKYCTGRVITVSSKLHHQFKYGEKLPFFQMIAKNVGIRRARGEFVVATNIDIIFSDELMRFIARKELDPNRLYRVDRYDIRSDIPENLTGAGIQEYAWSNPIRSNLRLGPKSYVEELYGDNLNRRVCIPTTEFRANHSKLKFYESDGVWMVSPERDTPMENIHTNACGDFTLLSAAAWEAIAGYAEFAGYSFNIDSVGVLAAHYGGFEEVSLLPPCVCFHIEHSLGSGWTPEGEKKLFDRMKKNQVLSPEWPVLIPIIEEFRQSPVPVPLNGPDWGLASFELPEEPLERGSFYPSQPHPWPETESSKHSVGALLPKFDLDRITLWHEREAAMVSGNSARNSNLTHHLIQCYVPNEQGDHDGERITEIHAHLSTEPSAFYGNIKDYHAGTCLRFDPTYQQGVVVVSQLEIIDPTTYSTLWNLSDSASGCIGMWGTAELLPPLRDQPHALRIRSTGDDPQVWLPPLPYSYDELLIRFELAHFPIF